VLLGGLTLASALTAEPASKAASEHVGDVAPELLVAICGSCHRPDNVAMPVIHGRPAGQLLAQLERFPGQRDVTVMHRLTVGLSGRELEAVAQRLAAGTP
jgi:cytochrome c553